MNMKVFDAYIGLVYCSADSLYKYDHKRQSRYREQTQEEISGFSAAVHRHRKLHISAEVGLGGVQLVGGTWLVDAGPLWYEYQVVSTLIN